MFTSSALRLVRILNPIMRWCVILGIGVLIVDKTVGVSYLLGQDETLAATDASVNEQVGPSASRERQTTARNTRALTVESIQSKWAQQQSSLHQAGARTAGTAVVICGLVWLASCAGVPLFLFIRRRV